MKARLMSESKKINMIFLLFLFTALANFLYLHNEPPSAVLDDPAPVADLGRAGGY